MSWKGAGVSEATAKAWETGTRAPNPATQVRLADALGLDFEDLEQPGPADAEDLRRLRESLGLTQAEAARRLGIDASALKRGGGWRRVATRTEADGEGVRRSRPRSWRQWCGGRGLRRFR